MSALRFSVYVVCFLVLCGFVLSVSVPPKPLSETSDISKYFKKDEDNSQVKVFEREYLIPKKTGKYVLNLPKTSAPVSILDKSYSYIY